MAQGGDRSEGDADLADVPDARLTELLRAPTAKAYPALQELRRRHHPSVLLYARLCAAGDSAAGRLAAESFTTAARETARGFEPYLPLRHHLLLLTARLAASWAADDRSAGVDPALLLVLNAGGLPDGPTPPLLPAFQTLPARTQGLIFYGALEEEPLERTAAFLGLSRADVAHGTPLAVKALAQACLRHRLAASDDPRCPDFRRLIEEAVRPDAPRYSADLDAHKAHCPHCTAAFEDLTALRDAPRQALAEGLLPWSGTPYIRPGTPAPAPAPAPEPPASRPSRPPQRRYLLTSMALGVALAPLLVFLLTSNDGPYQHPTAATPSPPPVTVTATVSVSPSPTPTPTPTPTPSPSPTSKSPSPKRTSHRPTPSPSRRPSPSPTPSPPGSAYAQVVNLASGRCLDIRDEGLWQGNDVITAPCSSSPTQRWRVDSYLGVLRSAADDDFCLDSRGSTERGVGIWECDAVYSSNGQNLRFTVDPDGTIRPAIAIETAVTPNRWEGVCLEPLNGGLGQRWQAGAK